MLVLIKGGGDLASGIAVRLFRAGFSLVMTELSHPTVVRRAVSFAPAVWAGQSTVEGVTARRADSLEAVEQILAQGAIPLLVEPEQKELAALSPAALVDAVMAKKNTGLSLEDATIVIGVGPGFCAGQDCHAVIETQRGHSLGRAIYGGSAAADTGIPGTVLGFSQERIIRAPGTGLFQPLAEIGDLVKQGAPVAQVGSSLARAQISGIVRGMLAPGTPVTAGMKAGDIAPRGERSYCYTVSDKALAVGGGCLEAILHFSQPGRWPEQAADRG